MKNKLLIQFGLGIILLVAIMLPNLVNAGILEGSIRDSEGNLIQEAVYVSYTGDFENWEGYATYDGTYRFEDLPMGIYVLRATPLEEDTWLYGVYFPDVIHMNESQYIWLNQDQIISDLDFTLGMGGRISGSVVKSDDSSFDPYEVYLSIISIDDVSDWAEELVGFELENPDDFFSMAIPPGVYFVRANTHAPDFHTPTFYGDTFLQLEAELVFIEPGSVTEGIDIQMIMGGGVRGTVTTREEGPLENALVYVVADMVGAFGDVSILGVGITDENGVYEVYGVPQIPCFLAVQCPDDRYPIMWYDGVYNPRRATAVNVEVGEFTENINFRLYPSATLFGTLRGPNQEIIEPWSVGLHSLQGYGNDWTNVTYWDEEGNWRIEGGVIPGIHTLRVADWSRMYNAYEMYLGNAVFSWDAQWIYVHPGVEAGPFDIVLQEGGTIYGRVTDDNGDPISDGWVELFLDGRYFESTDLDFDGEYYLNALPPGNYKMYAQYDNDEFNMDYLFVTTFHDGSFSIEEAESFELQSGQELEINIQLQRGGLLAVEVMDLDGFPYDFFSNSMGVMILPVSREGVVYWDAATIEGWDDDDEFFPSGSTMLVLPEGEYTLLAFPAYINFGFDLDPRSARRTFLGGSFNFQNAEFIQVYINERSDVEFNMVETGHQISGTVGTIDGESTMEVVILYDTDNFPVSVFIDIMGWGEFNFAPPEYSINGVPDGTYYAVVLASESNYPVSTWYPNIADPSFEPVSMTSPPDGVQGIVVAGEDLENVNIIMQTADNMVSVPGNSKNRFLPDFYQLESIYPNPFNDVAKISFSIPRQTVVTLSVYDIMGRMVKMITKNEYSAGNHTVILDAKDMATGMYFIRMNADKFNTVKQIVLIK